MHGKDLKHPHHLQSAKRSLIILSYFCALLLFKLPAAYAQSTLFQLSNSEANDTAQSQTKLPAESGPDWKSPDSMPVEDDWIMLSSGEWLRGKIEVLYEDDLEFDSDDLDLLHIDWEDVAEVRSAQILSIRFSDGVVRTGKVMVRNGLIYFDGSSDPHYVSEIVSMAAGEDIESNFWTLEIDFGGSAQSGNTNEKIFTGGIEAKRRTNNSVFDFTYTGFISKVEKERNAENHRLSSNMNVFLQRNFFWRVYNFEYFKDKFQNIDDRFTIGSGIGYQILDEDEISWDISVSPSYQFTRFDTVEIDNDRTQGSPALVVDTEFEYEITDDLEWEIQFTPQFTEKDSGLYKHYLKTTLDIELTGDLDLELSYIWERTEEPQRDDEGNVPDQNDTWVTFGLSYEF